MERRANIKMVKGECPFCKRTIIEDLDKYKEKYPNESEVMCPYCNNLIKLKKDSFEYDEKRTYFG